MGWVAAEQTVAPVLRCRRCWPHATPGGARPQESPECACVVDGVEAKCRALRAAVEAAAGVRRAGVVVVDPG